MNRTFVAALSSVLLAATVMSSACGSNPVIPTTTSGLTTEVYTGTVARGGSGFYSFSVSSAGTTTVTFASLTNSSTGRALDVPMVLAVGTPAGEGCTVTSSVTASPGLASQFASPTNSGTYCLRFSDAGSLTVAAIFGVRIVHP